jgi:hypothetical protein
VVIHPQLVLVSLEGFSLNQVNGPGMQGSEGVLIVAKFHHVGAL